jgi:serine/threonine protein kinase
LDGASLERDPVEELAEEFLQRRRAGQEPSIAEYAERYPQWAQRIRDLFPALVLMENLKPDRTPAHDPAGPLPEPGELPVRRLGDYRIVREIGRGGMGVVYEAEQESLSRRVAVKVLPGVYLSSRKGLRRFQREARAAARLHHTNIVPIFGFGQQDGIHYYVMQYIRGRGLDEVLAELSLHRKASTGRAQQDVTPVDADARGRGDHAAIEVANTLFLGRFASTPEGAALSPADSPADSPRASGDAAQMPAPQEASCPPVAAELPSMSSESGLPESQAARPAVLPDALPGLSPFAADYRYWRSVAGIGVQVAGALHYAHNQGTLHRDIKPGNLLLDTQGTVWIADFGLAKLAEQDDLTRSGDVVGTLRYMAPEQFEGGADPRTDVYSLGLTLYELMTLRPAFNEQDRGRLIRQVTQEEPPAPRRINPGVPRDLETIVVKAIARNTDHRYQSAGELAEDLQRFLEDRPILARRTSAIHRLWRWCRRNRAVASLAALAMLLLIAVAIATSVGYVHTSAALVRESLEREKAEQARRQENDARQRAEAEYGRAEANLRLAMQAFEEVFAKTGAAPRIQPLDHLEETLGEQADDPADSEGVADFQQAGWTSVVTEKDAAVLQSMLKFYDRFAQQNSANVNLQEEAARAYHRVGEIQQRLGNHEQAETAYRRALEMVKLLSRARPEKAAYVTEAAAILNKLGAVVRTTGRFSMAWDSHVAARDLLLSQPPEVAAAAQCRFELARTYNLLGAGMPGRAPWQHRPGRSSPKAELPHSQVPEGAGNHVRALEILKKLVEEEPTNPEYRLALARTYRDLALSAGRRGPRDDAAKARQEAIGILENLVADFPDTPDYRFELAETYALSGRHSGPGGPNEPDRLKRAIEIEAQLADRYPNVPEYQAALARVYVEQARVFQAAGRLEDSEKNFRQGVQLQQALAKRFPAVPQYQGELARDLFLLAHLLRSRGRTAEARTVLEQAVGCLEVIESQAGGPFAKAMLAWAYGSLAETLRQLGETAKAEEVQRKAQQAGVKLGPMPRGPWRFEPGRPGGSSRSKPAARDGT